MNGFAAMYLGTSIHQEPAEHKQEKIKIHLYQGTLNKDQWKCVHCIEFKLLSSSPFICPLPLKLGPNKRKNNSIAHSDDLEIS